MIKHSFLVRTLLTVVCLSGTVFFFWETLPTTLLLLENMGSIAAGLMDAPQLDTSVVKACVGWMAATTALYAVLL